MLPLIIRCSERHTPNTRTLISDKRWHLFWIRFRCTARQFGLTERKARRWVRASYFLSLFLFRRFLSLSRALTLSLSFVLSHSFSLSLTHSPFSLSRTSLSLTHQQVPPNKNGKRRDALMGATHERLPGKRQEWRVWREKKHTHTQTHTHTLSVSLTHYCLFSLLHSLLQIFSDSAPVRCSQLGKTHIFLYWKSSYPKAKCPKQVLGIFRVSLQYCNPTCTELSAVLMFVCVYAKNEHAKYFSQFPELFSLQLQYLTHRGFWARGWS